MAVGHDRAEANHGTTTKQELRQTAFAKSHVPPGGTLLLSFLPVDQENATTGTVHGGPQIKVIATVPFGFPIKMSASSAQQAKSVFAEADAPIPLKITASDRATIVSELAAAALAMR